MGINDGNNLVFSEGALKLFSRSDFVRKGVGVQVLPPAPVSEYLGISLKRTAEILEFLVSIKLALPVENGRFTVGTSRIHLGSDSPMISKFHTNWRMQAIRSLETEDKNDLHYSSVITISDEDFKKIKSLLVKYIEEIKLIVKESPSEKVHSLCLDFFQITGKN